MGGRTPVSSAAHRSVPAKSNQRDLSMKTLIAGAARVDPQIADELQKYAVTYTGRSTVISFRIAKFEFRLLKPNLMALHGPLSILCVRLQYPDSLGAPRFR